MPLRLPVVLLSTLLAVAGPAVAAACPAAPPARPAAGTIPPDPTPEKILLTLLNDDEIPQITDRDSNSVTFKTHDGLVFWFGHRFLLNNRHHYVGFLFWTRGEGGDPSIDPAATVAIAQVTFILEAEDGKSRWVPRAADRKVAETGARNRADAFDRTRAIQPYRTKDGGLVMAVPTKAFENGETRHSLAIFHFDTQYEYGNWRYLGSAVTGTENSANCGEDLPIKCVVSTGTLAFVAPKAGTMPTLRVTMRGTTIAGPGRVRTLGPADTARYSYDARAKRYTPPLDR